MIHSIGASHTASHRRASLWVGLAFVAVAALYATSARLSQLSAWERLPALYVASGVPMMTTLDAYYSLRLARQQAAGTFVPHGPAPARHYARPEQGAPGEWYDQREPQFLPLLSRTIAAASSLTGGDIDRAALLLSPVLSSLFMIPLFLCCWRLGAPAAGLMAGLIATFSFEYFRRTSIGWVDTDALNLFFPWMVSWIILMMGAGLRRDRLLLLAAAAGTTLYVYYLWYPQPGLLPVFAAAMAVHLLVAGVSWQRSALCVAVLLVFANPAHLINALSAVEGFVQRYLWAGPTQPGDALRFPSVWSTISEVQVLDRGAMLRLILGRTEFVLIGLIAFLGFALTRWRALPALAPVLLLGALALVSSRRFVIYLAPFVGIGWGWIIALLIKGVFGRIDAARGAGDPTPREPPPDSRLARVAQPFKAAGAHTTLACTVVVAVFLVWLAPVSGRGYVPQPAVPAPVFRDLQILGERLPAESRLWTWWDLGFAIVDTTGFGVYHDGSAQYTAQTNVIAASFVHDDQRVLHRLIGFVDREGNRGIRRLAVNAADIDDLLNRMSQESRPTSEVPVYVLFTSDMLPKYPSLRHLSTPRGTAPHPGEPGIRQLACERIADDQLHCGPLRADLRIGALEGGWPDGEGTSAGQLRRAVVVEKGRAVRERDYGSVAGPTLQVVLDGNALAAVYLLDESAYRSNLNQMFVLGRFDGDYFEEILNDFPNARVFRVVGRPGAAEPDDATAR